jgi:hypothetical protein
MTVPNMAWCRLARADNPGDEGWELVAVTANNIAYLRRQIEPARMRKKAARAEVRASGSLRQTCENQQDDRTDDGIDGLWHETGADVDARSGQ